MNVDQCRSKQSNLDQANVGKNVYLVEHEQLWEVHSPDN